MGNRTDAAFAANQSGRTCWDRAHRRRCRPIEKGSILLHTIAVVLLILWVLGLVTSYTLGGFIHILLVIAAVMALLKIIGGRRSLSFGHHFL